MQIISAIMRQFSLAEERKGKIFSQKAAAGGSAQKKPTKFYRSAIDLLLQNRYNRNRGGRGAPFPPRKKIKNYLFMEE